MNLSKEFLSLKKIKQMEQSNEPTIIEMNRTICEFMGWEFKPYGEDWFKAYHDGHIMWADTGYGLNQILLKGFRYHEDWEKLMPVVEKISKMKLLNADNTECTDPQDVCYPRTFGMPTEDGKQVMVRFNGFCYHEADTLIEATHKACYEAAKFEISNQQKQNND